MRKKPTSTANHAATQRRPGDAGPNSKTFVFHTGIQKTGSTALQAYLALNAGRLKEAGVAYAFTTGPGVGPGNGQRLFELMHKGTVAPNLIDDLLTIYLDNCPTAIISSEAFTRFGQTEWQQISEASQRLHGRVRIVTFVRDLAPYCASLHSQLLSSGEIPIAFEAFADHAQFFQPVVDSLKCMLQMFQRDSMTVLHYESVIGAIDKAFLGSLGLSSDMYDAAPIRNRTNRSLTEFEQDIILRVIKSSGLQMARGLSGHLKERRPHLKFTRRFGAKLIEQLGARHAADVDWINRIFFGGKPVMQVARSMPDSRSKSKLNEEISKAIYSDVIDW
jgi:hypothetical protein